MVNLDVQGLLKKRGDQLVEPDLWLNEVSSRHATTKPSVAHKFAPQHKVQAHISN